jgi:hypothetical protein
VRPDWLAYRKHSRSTSGNTTIGFLPPSSSVYVLDRHLRRSALDRTPGPYRANQCDALDLRVTHKRIPDRAASGHDIERTRWQHLTRDVAQSQRRQRGPFEGLLRMLATV